jgi:Phage tail sheath C-terminal domain
MAQLSSPGISVSVIDESFYLPAAPGTVPLLIVASQENKMNSAGTGTAPGTLKANAGKVYLLTSQQDLGNTFGIPYFQTDAENNPINASEVNEYGLQAAYSFLGVSNRAYVVRADVDTKQLIGTANIPTAAPADGTMWFDIADTNFGIFEWNGASADPTNASYNASGQTFTNQASVNNISYLTDTAKMSSDGNYTPKSSYGAQGDYALTGDSAGTTTLIKLWYKKGLTSTAAGTWVEVGSSTWQASRPTITATAAPSSISSSSTLYINGIAITGASTIAGLVTAIGTAVTANPTVLGGITAAVVNGYLNIYSNGTANYNSHTLGSVTIGSNSTSGFLTILGLTAGTFLPPQFNVGPHTSVPQFGTFDQAPTYTNGAPTGSVWLKTTPVNLGANWFIKKYNANTATWITQPVQLFANGQSALATLDPTGGGINLALGTTYVKYNDGESGSPLFRSKIYTRTGTGPTAITSQQISASTFTASSTYSFTIAWSQVGSTTLTTPVTVSITATGVALTDAQAFASAFTAVVTDPNITISVSGITTAATITISHNAGGDMRFVDGTGTPLNTLFSLSASSNWYASPTGVSANYIATLWAPTISGSAVAAASLTSPTDVPLDGTLWYNSSLENFDIMVNNGSAWVGYKDSTAQNMFQAIYGTRNADTVTDPAGPIVSASQPTTQSDGSLLANGDIWIDTSDLEMFPSIYVYNGLTTKWVAIDVTDQTSSKGIVFADARWNTDGGVTLGGTPSAITDLLVSNFVDFDCPSPALYPKGTLLFNTRRSDFNVKAYHQGYINPQNYNTMYQNALMTNYFADRWVSAAPNTTEGVGQFGRKAQRAVVLKALLATIESNTNIRQPDTVIFNLLSCPGYLETSSALVGLNTDNGQTAFIIADAPARLTPDATSLSNWGNNTMGAAQDGEDGLIFTDPYSAVYYPWGYTSDLLGNNIVVPPSHIMLRTIALSDNVSYPWFAPAGVRRGGVTNASSVGYVDGQTGEFKTVALNIGQRDTLAGIHVNPITYIAGTGLVVYGQKTRQLIASSLDRINVARLVIYLRYQLNQLAKPYVFEPNDKITRTQIGNTVTKLLVELTAERALYDFLVVCDTSNNTPARIDANELYVDIAIEPVKAVEFIYIPLRLENTGAIKGLGK